MSDLNRRNITEHLTEEKHKMWKTFRFIAFCGSVLSCDTNKDVLWSPQTSIIMSSLGWRPFLSYDFSNFQRDYYGDNFGLESFDYFGGDIVEDDEYRNSVNIKDRLWPKGKIPYIISSQLDTHKNTILEAMKYIENKTCISFIPRRTEKNYIDIFKGTGCHSRVGMYGGAQLVSLGSGCYKLGKVMHELVHVIGFYHEQSRPDRDTYINIHWENVQEGHEKNFAKMKPGQSLLLSDYDYESITHYSEYSFSKDKMKGLKTMTPKKRGVVLKSPGDKVLSADDIKRIAMLYKC